VKHNAEFPFPSIVVHRIVTGQIEENAYLIRFENADAVLVDPGDDAAQILELIRRTDSKVLAILLTHAHFDHIGAVQGLREALHVKVYLHRDAWDSYARAHIAPARYNLPFTQPDPPEEPLELGQLHFGALEFTGLFTPGHAPGHVALYSPAGFVISGDALFRNTIGRTDIPGADHALLIERIKTQLYTLPDATVVFPGHGAETTIGAEKIGNPHTRG
jgi:hydroxyacylglutathione hydrolase